MQLSCLKPKTNRYLWFTATRLNQFVQQINSRISVTAINYVSDFFVLNNFTFNSNWQKLNDKLSNVTRLDRYDKKHEIEEEKMDALYLYGNDTAPVGENKGSVIRDPFFQTKI